MSTDARNEAFNLCDEVEELFSVGDVHGARQAIMRAIRALSAQQPEAVAGDPTNPDGTERLCRLLYHRRPEPRDYIGSDCRMLHHAATLIERYQRITADRAEEFSEWWERHGQFSRAGGGEYEKTFAYNAWNAALNPGFGEPAP